MRPLNRLLLSCAFAFAIAAPAAAEPKGPNGEACSSSATGVKHTIKGNDYICDKCVFSKCDTSGGQISNCQTVTHWSNCVAATRVGPGGSVLAPPGQVKELDPGGRRLPGGGRH
jgi:hypothetical protein